MHIFSHNEQSEGAKLLARELGIKRLRHTGSAFVGSQKKVVINWGSRNVSSEVAKCKVLNDPQMVEINANKLAFFQFVGEKGDAGPRVPAWTTSEKEAKKWVADGRVVVARTVLNGSSGKGIEFMEDSKPDSFVKAPLYVEYVKKKDEYRVHFVGDKIIDFQRKALRADYDRENNPPNFRVRNLQNGFVFVRDGVQLPKDVIEQALKCAKTCGLDFGAIDLVYNEKEAKAYVLEVNTAPGLQGTTVTNYAAAFKDYM